MAGATQNSASRLTSLFGAGTLAIPTVQITKPVQATVMYEHCIGADGYGPLYAPAVPLLAIIDLKEQQVRTMAGVLAAARGQLTFLDVTSLKAATGVDGRIRDIDIVTLPDGTSGAILAVGGFIDAGTTHAVATDVWIG